MGKDQMIGGLLCAGSIAGILIYAWILFFTEWTLILLQITALIAVGSVLGILAWIGYTLATTPPPKPIEEIEKEIEDEIKKLEQGSGEKA